MPRFNNYNTIDDGNIDISYHQISSLKVYISDIFRIRYFCVSIYWAFRKILEDSGGFSVGMINKYDTVLYCTALGDDEQKDADDFGLRIPVKRKLCC